MGVPWLPDKQSQRPPPRPRTSSCSIKKLEGDGNSGFVNPWIDRGVPFWRPCLVGVGSLIGFVIKINQRDKANLWGLPPDCEKKPRI